MLVYAGKADGLVSGAAYIQQETLCVQLYKSSKRNQVYQEHQVSSL